MLSIFLSMCLLVLGEGLTGNPSPISQAATSATDFPRAVGHAFAQADRITALRQASNERGPPSEAIANRATSPHETHQSILPRASALETSQERFEETTRVLINDYNFTPDEISSGMVSGTALRSMLHGEHVKHVDNCRSHFQITDCNPYYKYRTIDGTCNNVENPTWGMASSCFLRLMDPVYSDGISLHRKSVSGYDLPLSRVVSVNIHNELDLPSRIHTHLFMAHGQFLAHDITHAPLSKSTRKVKCCPPSRDSDPDCDPILVPEGDYFYGQFGITCLNNIRSAKCATCTLGPRQQINQVTSYIDLSIVYDVDIQQSLKLRNLDGTGTLKFQTSPVAGELLPKSRNPDNDACSFQNPRLKCFQSGDSRVNVQPGLLCQHTLFLREHNRVARQLKLVNPHWDEDTLFQESRRIAIAEMQMIVFNEWLPLVLGPEAMERHDLGVLGAGYTRYNPTTEATLPNEFSVAAFRLGHSMVNTYFSEIGHYTSSVIWLRENFQYPFGFHFGQLDRIAKGLTLSPTQQIDRYIVQDLSNHLLQVRGNVSSGMDLPALNIQRGRDHGIPPYVRMVEFCGGPPITSFRQLDDFWQKEGASAVFERVYESVEDIDVYAAAMMENPAPGAVIGATLSCIIAPQFQRLKFGDRFYFEHGGQAGSFTPRQLAEIRNTTLSRLFCDNTSVESMQKFAMLFPSTSNAIVPCNELPRFDFSAWRAK